MAACVKNKQRTGEKPRRTEERNEKEDIETWWEEKKDELNEADTENWIGEGEKEGHINRKSGEKWQELATQKTNTQQKDTDPSTNKVKEVEIKIPDKLEGQFDMLQEELSLTEFELKIVEQSIREITDEKVDKYREELGEDMRDAIANLFASILLQEYKQLEEDD